MNKNNLDILKKRGTGFKTPNGYFETIEDAVLAEIYSENIPVEAGFKTPKDYFDKVEAEILDKINPIQAKTPVKFDVPEDYFKTLEDRVFERIHEEDNAKQHKVIHIKSRIVRILTPVAVAASLLFIFILNYNKNNENYSFDDLAATEVENWIENDLIFLESTTIAEVFNDVTLEEELNDDDLELLDYINGTDIESALLTE